MVPLHGLVTLVVAVDLQPTSLLHHLLRTAGSTTVEVDPSLPMLLDLVAVVAGSSSSSSSSSGSSGSHAGLRTSVATMLTAVTGAAM